MLFLKNKNCMNWLFIEKSEWIENVFLVEVLYCEKSVFFVKDDFFVKKWLPFLCMLLLFGGLVACLCVGALWSYCRCGE